MKPRVHEKALSTIVFLLINDTNLPINVQGLCCTTHVTLHRALLLVPILGRHSFRPEVDKGKLTAEAKSTAIVLSISPSLEQTDNVSLTAASDQLLSEEHVSNV